MTGTDGRHGPQTSSSAADLAAIDDAFDALAADRPAGEVLATLRELEPRLGPDARARLLVARAVAGNRLGLPGEALGDLHEALLAASERDQPAVALQAWSEIARVHAWRGDGREAALALLQILAVDGGAAALGQVLLDAGRIEHEIGRPARAVPLQCRALALADLDLARRARGLVELAQSALAAGETARAAEALAEFATLPQPTAARLRHLASLARARIALRGRDIVSAQMHLDEAAGLAPQQPNAFEHVECGQVEAEIALAGGDAAPAAARLRSIVARMAADDLAGPEIEARLLEAAALDAVGDGAAADRTLAAALRRAQAGNLGFYADRVRERFVLRGRPPPDSVTFPDVAPTTLAEPAGPSRFVRRRPLGAGGAASVFRAYDIETGREIALKVLKQPGYDSASRDAWLGAAQREAYAAGLVRHPGVARVLGLVLEDDAIMLIRELIEGRDLRRAMADPRPLPSALRLLAEIAWALAAIHMAGIAHGDIKPENVILRPSGHPAIIDLGASRTGIRAGEATPLTAAYASPERRGGGLASALDDVHAFAVMGHEMLTGARPPLGDGGWTALFADGDARVAIGTTLIGAACPREITDLLQRALRPRFWQRRPDAMTIALELEAAARSIG